MTKTELLELIRNGENSGVEFKRDTIDNRALAKELVAFANFQGGQVLLGVDDDGKMVGITRANLEEWVMTACRDKIRPEIIPFFDTVKDVEPGKDVAIIRVERGWTVHHVWHDQHSSYYIRIGTVSREASREELERLFQQRGAFNLDIRPVSGSSVADLDFRRLRDYFKRVRQQDAPPEGDLTAWRTLLNNTEFLRGDSQDAPATVAGLLLFGIRPNRHLPQAGIDAAAYPGSEKDYAAKDRQPLRGPMTPLLDSSGALVENGIVEQVMEFCRRNLEIATDLKDGVRRSEDWPYPLEAIREGIVNALVHRDYLLSATDIELSIYADRLEIVSPGRLPNGITPDRMRVGCRASRNQLLKDVMRDYGYLEHMGMGIPRKVVRLMMERNGTDPDLIEEGESFILKLWKSKKPNTSHNKGVV